MNLDLTDPSCPGGEDCPYKWHTKGMEAPDDVDTTYTTASGIRADLGIDWSHMLSDSYFRQVSNVLSMDDKDDFMDYFTKGNSKALKSAPEWPIVRFTGFLDTSEDVMGYGVLVVDGDLNVGSKKFDWTGLVLVGGRILVSDGTHLHVKGAAMAGLGCTDEEVTNGECRSTFLGDHVDIKYRPCEVAQSWRRLMVMQPVDGLWREISAN